MASSPGMDEQQHDTTTDETAEPAEPAEPSLRHGASQLNARERGWPAWTTAYLAAMAEVPDQSRAASVSGVNRSTPQRLALRDPEFALAEQEARDVALDRLERVMYQRASVGQPVKKTVTKTNKDGSTETTVVEEVLVSDALGMFYMKRWRNQYRDTVKVEQTGADGGPIRIETERKLDEAAERLDAEVVRLADARAARDAASGGG